MKRCTRRNRSNRGANMVEFACALVLFVSLLVPALHACKIACAGLIVLSVMQQTVHAAAGSKDFDSALGTARSTASMLMSSGFAQLLNVSQDTSSPSLIVSSTDVTKNTTDTLPANQGVRKHADDSKDIYEMQAECLYKVSPVLPGVAALIGPVPFLVRPVELKILASTPVESVNAVLQMAKTNRP